MPTVSSPHSGRMKTDKKQPIRIDGNECLERYLRDVRRYSVLSRVRTNGLSPSKLWKAAHSGRSSSSAPAYSPVAGLEVTYISGYSAPDPSAAKSSTLLLSSRPRYNVCALCATRYVIRSRGRTCYRLIPSRGCRPLCGSRSRVWIGIQSCCSKPGIGFIPP